VLLCVTRFFHALLPRVDELRMNPWRNFLEPCQGEVQTEARPHHSPGPEGLLSEGNLYKIVHANFYEKALFVKPTWRLYVVAERNSFVPFALCFYPHFLCEFTRW
jgi:hypothetical protein